MVTQDGEEAAEYPWGMALPRKGTRRIVVDDTIYRWTVSPDDEPGVAMLVEQWDGPAQRMKTWVEHGIVISPGLVRRAILYALANGWTPSAKSPDAVFRLVQEPDDTEDGYFN